MVKEILVRIFDRNDRAMNVKELCKEMLKEKMVSPNTVMLNLQKYKDAITHLKKAEQLTEAGSTNMIQIYQELAFSLNECGQHEEAISYIDKMDDWDCDHIEMQVLKGHFLLTQDKLDDALNVFKKAIIDSGSSPDVILHIAVSVLDNRFMKKAYDILKMLFNIGGPRWKKGYSHMALCCKELGMNNFWNT